MLKIGGGVYLGGLSLALTYYLFMLANRTMQTAVAAIAVTMLCTIISHHTLPKPLGILIGLGISGMAFFIALFYVAM